MFARIQNFVHPSPKLTVALCYIIRFNLTKDIFLKATKISLETERSTNILGWSIVSGAVSCLLISQAICTLLFVVKVVISSKMKKNNIHFTVNCQGSDLLCPLSRMLPYSSPNSVKLTDLFRLLS